VPLYRSAAVDAIKLRKANEYSFWGSRDAANRVEPIASPNFELDLKLEAGDSIFTVGSCFARNVETKLAAAGYRLPMRDLMNDRTFAGVHPRALNNFSAPSIWNELSWATGEIAFDPDLAIVEYSPGKWLDLHVTHNVRPAPRETVLRRRSAITSAYRSFADCKLIVVTLGLVEVWYDLEAQAYLNTIPPPPLVRRYPERFELHVLDYAETLDHCDRAIQLFRKYGREDVTILMSVSPVALGVTHRPQDVMTANCYSKSVLRAVVEEIVARHDRVEYFPSYESVVLSDRGLSWTNDFTHVTDTLIAHNVDRLAAKLTDNARRGSDFETIRSSIETAGASAAYLHAIEARKGDAAQAARFFMEFGEWSALSPTFATEHVEWLVDQRQADKALEIAAIADVHSERMAMARSRALLILKRSRDALRILHDPMFERSRSNRYWSLRVQAEGMVGDLSALEASLAGWCQAHPKRISQARLHVARALLLNSSTDRALELIKLALVEDAESALAHMLAAEAHLHRGEQTEAARSFGQAQPKTDSEVRRYNKLKDRIGEFVGA